jgi:membrane protease YdiL (CAAX protease family)
LINTASLVGLAASVIVTLWIWRGNWRPDRPDFELRMALTITLGLLFGLHVNPQDGLVLVAPAVLFYDYLRRSNLPRQGYAIFALSCPTLFLISEFTVGGALGIRFPVVAEIILVTWISKALRESEKHLKVNE